MNPDELYVDTVADLLEIEEIDRNLYRGRNAAISAERTALYGGQVAAQALMAAGLTVEPDRRPHSLHGYFLRAGQVDKPVILRVDIDRDGGSFSARHVAAIQDGAVIFSMLASFHRDDPSDALDRMPPSEVPGPDACPARPSDLMVDVREVTLTETVDGRELYSDCMWLRTSDSLDDDPLTQACGLTYLSDLGSGFGRLPPPVGGGGPSLDHAVWLHSPARADDWMLLHMWPRKATPVRGLYDAAMRDQAGNLCAVVVQEHLINR